MINALPAAPSPTDDAATFDSKAFAFAAALSPFVTQVNATAAEMQQNSDIAAAMLMGMSLPQYAGTSSDALTIATGAVSIQTQSGKAWMPGQVVIVANGSNYMKGTVTSYSGTTLAVNVTTVAGTGTFMAWSIGLSYAGLLLASSGENSDITSLGALTAINGGPLAGFRNYLINGDAQVSQRLTQLTTSGLTGTTYGAHFIDMFNVVASGSALTVSQGTPGQVLGEYFHNSVLLTGAASNTGAFVSTRVESVNARYLCGKTATFSAYVFSSAARSITVYLQSPGTQDASFATGSHAQQTFALAANTWTRISLSAALPLVATANGLRVGVDVGALTAGQTFQVTGCQLEQGAIATRFERRSYAVELMHCQRYYRQYGSYMNGAPVGFGHATSATSAVFYMPMPNSMRIGPNYFYSTGTASDYEIFIGGSAIVASAAPSGGVSQSPDLGIFTLTVAGGLTTGQYAVARLKTLSAYVGFSAEIE